MEFGIHAGGMLPPACPAQRRNMSLLRSLSAFDDVVAIDMALLMELAVDEE